MSKYFISMFILLTLFSIANTQDSSKVISAIDWSSDGIQVAFGRYDGTVEIYDLSTAQTQQIIPPSIGVTLTDIAWNSFYTNLIAYSSQVGIVLKDLSEATNIRFLGGDPVFRDVSSIEFSPDGSKIAGAIQDSVFANLPVSIMIWDSISGEKLATIPGKGSKLTSIAWSPDGSRIAGGSFSDSLENTDRVDIWDANTGELLYTVRPVAGLVHAVAWTSDNLRIITASTDVESNGSGIQIWDVSTQQLLSSYNASYFDKRSIHPNDNWLAVSDSDAIRIIDLSTFEVVKTAPLTQRTSAMAWNPDGTQLAYDDFGTLSFLEFYLHIPIANAGIDQTINALNGSTSVTLDGSGSSDVDGSIVSYVWTDSTGAQVATGVSPTVELPVGVHPLTLTVTDDDGATASDDDGATASDAVVITVVED